MFEIGTAFLVSLTVGLTTALGWLVAQFAPPNRKTLSFLFGLAAGIVLVVLTVDLVPEVLEQAGLWQLVLGGGAGWMLMRYFEERHHHHHQGPETIKAMAQVGYLIGIGVALHNLIDGFGIGVGFAAGGTLGWSIALAGLAHNLPFGMAIVMPLRAAEISATRALLAALFPGLVTPLGTLAGASMAGSPSLVFGLGLSVTGGSMIFLLVRELLPRGLREDLPLTLVGTALGAAVLLAVKLYVGGHV